MEDNVDDVIGCEPVVLTEYHTSELWKCIDGIPHISNSTEVTKKCERLEHILSIYSNKYLLFPIVPKVTSRLMNMVRLSSPPLDSQSEYSLIFFNTFSKFVGFKQTSKYLPIEINLLKDVLECAEYYSKSSTSESTIQFNNDIYSGIQIWLYILIKNPFNLRNIARGTADVDGLDSVSYRIKTLIENESKDLTVRYLFSNAIEKGR
uniref:Ras-GEF domain-containing protein n=1 Tax=Bursaphelenchus xylophilus TaxID=6326 RepID=A0A1I7S7A6_BURXY